MRMRFLIAALVAAFSFVGAISAGAQGLTVTTCGASNRTAGMTGQPQTSDPTGRICDTGHAHQVAHTPTVQNAAYASGNCLGGFNAVSVAVNNGQGGLLTNLRLSSVGGATATVTVYLFDSNPSASTCTDRSTFTLATADIDKLLTSPVAVTLGAPTGTTVTFASAELIPPRPFTAGGSVTSGVKTIYYGLVSGSAFTPASTSDIHVRIGAVLN